MYPRPKEVSYISDYKLLITFDNSEKRVFNAQELINNRLFASLKNKSIFKNAKVKFKTLEWPDGTDICPDDLYDLSRPFSEFSHTSINSAG